MASTNSADRSAIAKKLVDNLLNDFRNLSNEAKRKHTPLKEAAESGIILVRNATTRSDDFISVIIQDSNEILQPLIMGCETKNPRIVQICVLAMQRLITHEAISVTVSTSIINSMWLLMESGIEELKLLQTITLLLTTNTNVQGDALAKAIVLCFRLYFAKDMITVNTASATVRQLVDLVFERCTVESVKQPPEDLEDVNLEELKIGSRNPPKSLQPLAADAFLLFQDLVQLVNADQPFWLIGLTEMTRTFGLELLESVLTKFPHVFFKYREFSFLLKERVCPLVIKLFSPNIKYRQGLPPNIQQTAPFDKPYFPISMRLLRVVSLLIQKYYALLVTECEIFLSLVVKFLDPDKPNWQRCLALEVLYKLAAQPDLLKSFCQCYDMKPHSTKIFYEILHALDAYIQSLFTVSVTNQSSMPSGNNPAQTQGTPPALLAGIPVGPGATPQPAFFYHGIWIPLTTNVVTNINKSVFLEMMEKLEPPTIPDGHGISVAYACLLEIIKSVAAIIDGEVSTGLQGDSKANEKGLQEQLINSSWCGLLKALFLLLEASTDESATENILKAVQCYTNLSGRLNMNVPRDAFITALCKASLPPHYTLTVLNTQNKQDLNTNNIYNRALNQDMGTTINMGQYMGETDLRQQIVAVGTPLPTASLPIGAQQGPVMLTAKNLQCMRAILGLAHCHGSVLGTAWHLILTTLQHLVWILGLKPSTGGSLKAGRVNDCPNAVITTAVMADLPVLSSMLSRLFESSQYLDDVALHHLIDALCKLSQESMELAYTNREPSLFAVAKLLETGLVNLFRVDVLWRPITNHLLEVSQHPHIKMREWGAEAVTMLVKSGLNHKYEIPLRENQKLQAMLLLPLQELSNFNHPDIRQKQLETILQILHNNGESLNHGWPLILGMIGAISDTHSENLIRIAFQCMQLVGADFLPIMPKSCLQICVDTAAKFGSQNQELNISLTAIGLLWSVSDYFFQNQEKIRVALEKEKTETSQMPAFDQLWMCLFTRLGDLCVDSRPAVRKSAGQTLFSTISAHGSLLARTTWQTVLWQVLFPLLDRVRALSGSASTDKTDMGGNILIHHSRNTAQKQWAETQVLTMSGVARVFNTKRDVLMLLGDFPRAWALLLEFIETAALSKNNEVSLAALKSFQEILNISTFSEKKKEKASNKNKDDGDKWTDLPEDAALWTTAWKVWHNIGIESTRPPPDAFNKDSNKKELSLLYVPSQPFLTALVQMFPALFQHIKLRFVAADFQKLSTVLQNAIAIPVHGEASPFIIPALTEVILTPLQECILQIMEMLQKETINGSENLSNMMPLLFNQLLVFVKYGCQAPPYGRLETRSVTTVKTVTNDWLTMNFVPFAEKALEIVVSMYQQCAYHPGVISSNVLHNIIKTLQLPLSLKYKCPSQSTWKFAIASLLSVLKIGLNVARRNEKAFQGIWNDLALALEEFLFSESTPPASQSLEEQQMDEAIDCKVVQVIREDILPFSNSLPKDFVLKIMALLNRGSIHSATSISIADSSQKLREEFAKSCFETLLQFSFIGSKHLLEADDTIMSKLAVTSLLQRFEEVIRKYVEDERLSGKCPLPRHRMAEISFVLKAISTLTASLKKAPLDSVDSATWHQLISLYPHLVDCTTSTSAQVCRSLKEALHEYKDLLQSPKPSIPNGI